ncbi:MAG: biotin/lipoyl-binding protein, partial [Candidatus Acidiferrales bacterium]
MKRAASALTAMIFAASLLFAGCSRKVGSDAVAEAPPPAQVEHEGDANLVQADHPDQFPLVAATEYKAPRRLVATGVVSPDISRTVPVISIAAGRVVEIRARLGDTVKKGQVLLRVQSADI